MKSYQPIKGRDHDGSYCTSQDRRLSAADERRARKLLGACINGRSHGKATVGIRCVRCDIVHRYGIAVARELSEFTQFVPVPLDTSAAASHGVGRSPSQGDCNA